MAISIQQSKQTVGSDGLHEVQILDSAGSAIDPTNYIFRVELYDATQKSKIASAKEMSDDGKYIISFDGTTRVNNTLVDGVLYFQLHRYQLNHGSVYYSQYEFLTNEDFQDDIFVSVCHKKLGLMIAANGCNTSDATNIITLTSAVFKGEDGKSLTFDDLTDEQKESLKGDDGEDYNLTDNDKQEIADLVDLSNYYDKDEVDEKIDDIETGSVDLSEYAKKDELPTATSELTNDSNFTTLVAVLVECYKKSETYTQSEVNTAISTAISSLIDSAPEALDTLKELADATTENAELIETLNTAIGLKLSKTEAATIYATIASLASYYTISEVDDIVQLVSDAVTTQISTHNTSTEAHADIRTAITGKVSVESGKGLSSNDYTDAEKTKLAGIEDGAEVNPTTLPNPYSLTINGTSYDGSEAKSITISAESGASSWDEITDKPNFADVATSGDYGDLSNVPSIDDAPTEDSTNAVSSGGVYDALQEHYTKSEIDTSVTTKRLKVGTVNIYETEKWEDGGEVAAGYIYTDRGNIYTTKGNMYSSDGNVYTSNGDIYSTEGDIYTVDGDFVAREGSFYKGSGDDKVEVAYEDELPTKTSDLTNDSGFVDNTTDNLLNYYLKTETFTRVEAFELLEGVASEDYVDNQLATKVDAVEGKSLSSNDYTDTEKTKLAGIATGADVTPTLGAVATSNSYDDLDDKPTIPSIDGLATVDYVDEAVGSIDVDLTGYVTSSELTSSLASKVDTVDGKSLSTNDYTTAEKTKLAGIATGADVTPTLATVATTGSYNDLTNTPTIDNIATVSSSATSPSITIAANTIYVFTATSLTRLTIAGTLSNDEIVHIKFTSGTTATTVTFSSSSMKVSGSVSASSSVEISIMGSVAIVTSVS